MCIVKKCEQLLLTHIILMWLLFSTMFAGCLAIAVQASANGEEAGGYTYTFVNLFCQQQYLY